MKDTELTLITDLSNRIVAQTLAGSVNLIYCIHMAEKLLRPYQLKLVKTRVMEKLSCVN